MELKWRGREGEKGGGDVISYNTWMMSSPDTCEQLWAWCKITTQGHMEKQETETGNGNWKWKLETEMGTKKHTLSHISDAMFSS